MAKAPRGQMQTYEVTLNGFQGSFRVEADSENAAILKVKAENESVRFRDSRNFKARAVDAPSAPAMPVLNATTKPST